MKRRDQVTKFVGEVLNEIQFKEAHEEIRRELMDHFQDAEDHSKKYGLIDEVAEQRILKDMGVPKELGIKLNQVHQPKTDRSLLGLVTVQLAIGFYAMFGVGHLGQQALWFVIGLIPFLSLVKIRPDKLQKSSWGIYSATMVLGVFSFFVGSRYEGQPYLSIGQIHIKFIDFSIVPLVIALAGIMAKEAGGVLSAKVKVGLAVMFPLITFIAIGSLYPAILFSGACLAMLIASSWSLPMTLGYTGVCALLISAFTKGQEFADSERFLSLVTAERHTDFIFSFLRSSSETLGAFTAAVSACLIVYLAIGTKNVRSTFGKTAIAGATAIFAIGIAWSLLSNTGFVPMPLTGVNFPFLSYGGSLMVGHMSLVGLIVGLQRRKNIQFFG